MLPLFEWFARHTLPAFLILIVLKLATGQGAWDTGAWDWQEDTGEIETACEILCPTGPDLYSDDGFDLGPVNSPTGDFFGGPTLGAIDHWLNGFVYGVSSGGAARNRRPKITEVGIGAGVEGGDAEGEGGSFSGSSEDDGASSSTDEPVDPAGVATTGNPSAESQTTAGPNKGNDTLTLVVEATTKKTSDTTLSVLVTSGVGTSTVAPPAKAKV